MSYVLRKKKLYFEEISSLPAPRLNATVVVLLVLSIILDSYTYTATKPFELPVQEVGGVMLLLGFKNEQSGDAAVQAFNKYGEVQILSSLRNFFEMPHPKLKCPL
ncbi:hypothetical protein FRB90_005985 [Tulasnella sp. 427]|nr:hypothetical protein FRB90_005985 [Tulasnella sp. 427]